MLGHSSISESSISDTGGILTTIYRNLYNIIVYISRSTKISLKVARPRVISND